MEYLLAKKISKSAHIWMGTDTACRMFSTGGLRKKNYHVEASAGMRSLCKICDDISNRNKPKMTGPATVSDCGCDVLPWEDCEHTEEAAQQAFAEMIGLALVPQYS